MIRTLALTFAALVGSCAPKNCAPPETSTPESVAVESCEERISWDGRSSVHVVRAPYYEAQEHLDGGSPVNIGSNGFDHVAGHYSSRGGVFKAGPRLSVGSNINYDCTNYTVTGRGSSSAGAEYPLQPGLTVQYSGCGGLCLVFAE